MIFANFRLTSFDEKKECFWPIQAKISKVTCVSEIEKFCKNSNFSKIKVDEDYGEIKAHKKRSLITFIVMESDNNHVVVKISILNKINGFITNKLLKQIRLDLNYHLQNNVNTN